jgi:hypothetical protein
MQLGDVAYVLADLFVALMASDEFQQKVFGMEPAEFRDCLACEVQRELESPYARRRPPTSVVADPDAPIDQSEISDQMARQVLENAPPAIRSVYGNARQNGAAVTEALNKALEEFRRLQEVAAECQLAEAS